MWHRGVALVRHRLRRQGRCALVTLVLCAYTAPPALLANDQLHRLTLHTHPPTQTTLHGGSAHALSETGGFHLPSKYTYATLKSDRR